MYRTVRSYAESEFEEKKSVFIGYASRVENEEQAKAFINTIRGRHKEASHNVYAYVIGANQGVQRYSDDGEPQGTAGIPVLEVIKKNEVTDVAVVVTRYFGGTLLGAGGLCRAYSKAAAQALKTAGVVEKVQGCQLSIIVDYDLLGIIQHKFKEKGWEIENIEYSDKVCLAVYAEVSRVDLIESCIREISSNRYSLSKSKENYYFKEEDKLFVIE